MKRFTATLAVGLAVFAVGCASEQVVTSDGRQMAQKPRSAPPTPETAQVNKMAFMVGSKPIDTTGNGYPDLIRATVSLFASPHPTSVHEDGVFEFRLYPIGTAGRTDARPLATWRKEGDQVRQAKAVAGWGPCYQFQLSLVEAGGDRFPLSAADLRCVFIPDNGGPPVRSDGVRSIQIGRR